MAAASDKHLKAPGPRNLITDVPGITVGHASDAALKTGVTVLACETSIAAAVDIRGGGPGTRETDALSAENLVGRADAIVLTGGSVFGLAAADAVTWALSERGVGLKFSPTSRALPIVASAVLHDLSSGTHSQWQAKPPYHDLGAAAAKALGGDFKLGSHGAGMGANAGLEKGGIGSTSLMLDDGLVCGAMIAVNPVGSVRMDDGKTFWAWPWEMNGEFGNIKPNPYETNTHGDTPLPDMSRLGRGRHALAGANTTIGIVATNASLSPSQCKRLAMMAQDGIARAVRPVHTPYDGDMIFCISTGGHPIAGPTEDLQITQLGSAMADCVARAIARGVFEAQF